MSARRSTAGQEEIRPAHATRVATGTLACPECDAPVALVPGRAASPADRLDCPYCRRAGPLREFLSLARPSRPARVVVRAIPGTGPGRSGRSGPAPDRTRLW